MRIVISGGGTGGHIFPAIAIANAIRAARRDAEILFVGATGRMEMERVPAAGYEIVGLPVRGFIRPLWNLRNVGVLVDLMRSQRLARQTLRRFRPDVAVGVGGYASGPTLNVAHAMGIPCVVQEQNSYAGVTNKLLANKASAFCVAYDGMERFFPADKVILTGNPVRQSLLENHDTPAEARRSLGLDSDRPTLLVVGGSLGARTLNEAIAAGLTRFEAEGIQVLWQTGKGYIDTCRARVFKSGTKLIYPSSFIADMAMAYRAADVVIARAGASTISELCLVGKAAILVPSPNVAEDHQTKNARALADRAAALLVTDSDAPTRLVDEAIALLRDDSRRRSLCANILPLAQHDSAARIAEIVIRAAATKT